MIDDSDELDAALLQYLYLTYIYAMSWVIIVVVTVSRSYRQLISAFLISNPPLLRDDWLYHEAKILFICVKLNTDIPCLDLRGQILFFCLCEGDQYQISQVAVSKQLTNNTQVLDRLDVLFFRIVLIQNINNIAITHPTMGNEHICRNCQEDHDDHSILPSSIQARAIVNVLPHHKQPLPKKNHPLVTLNQHEKQKEPQIQSLDFKINSTNEENSIDVPESIRLFTGKGRIQYQPGWVYEGDLVLGVREGYGRMTWPNGDYYEGIFQQGRANGHGLFQLTNGIKYSGQFSNDEISLGKRVSPQDREIYQGAFKNRQLDGYGVLIVRDEFQYKGLFRRNQMEGSGQMKYKDGSSYVGEFREGKKHGYGLWISCNGSRYEGYWFQGERDGVGTFISRDGERRQKKFERGRQVEL